MPMTPDQIKELLTNIVNDVNVAADYAGIIDPALVPLIAIGKAVDKIIPGLAANVAGMLQGAPISQAELDEKAAELAVLGDKGGI
jgi:hypothetical protein